MKSPNLSTHDLKAIIFLFLVIFTGFIFRINAQNPTEGEMTFSVRTVSSGGKYSPKHVLAIWVEDDNGFVIARKVMANNRKEYLYTWNSVAGKNTVDAITGSTLSSHRTHTVTWDCLDLNRNLVPDGDYTVFVEFTDKHAQGPIYSVKFTKGPECTDISLPDQTYFKDISLQFTQKLSYKETASICDGEIYNWHSKNLAKDGVYYDSLLTLNGCDSIYELDLTVNSSVFTSETHSVCEGETYVWHSEDITVPGVYYDSLLTDNGCDDVYELVFDVLKYPDSFSLNGPTQVVESNIFTYSVTENNDVTYKWSVTNGSILSYTANNTALVLWGSAGEGQINVVAENGSGCNSDAAIMNVAIGLTGYDSKLVNTIFVYPNPVNDKLIINNIQGASNYSILDITGKELKRGSLNEAECEIDLSYLEKGMYFIRIADNTIHRIIKK